MSTTLTYLTAYREIAFYKQTHKQLLLQLRKRDDFNLKSAFLTVYDQSIEAISFHSLKKFFTRNGFYANQVDIACIIKRLDNTYDEQVNFEEFVKCLIVFEIDEELMKSDNIASFYQSQQLTSPLKEKYFSLGKENEST
jgi:Ca2+-binding EF-hand superfamily protein